MDVDFIRGVVPPVITPVDAQDRVDEQALRNVVEHVIRGGVHGVFVLGTTGEFYGLDLEQKRRAIRITLNQVKGRVPVYAGASAITTRECAELAQLAEKEGAQAVTVLTPMFISPSEEELYQHFATIASSTRLPVLLYNNPDRTGINMSAGLIERLADSPNIVGVKDSSGDFTLMSEYIRRTRGKNFRVMAGRDTLILATLVYGGYGCVAATANVAPALVVEIYEKFQAGDLQGALEAQYRLAPLRVAFTLGTFPVVIKDALNLVGVFAGDPIKPVGHCTEANMAKLKGILENMGLIGRE
ncbi:MAG: 4-hydroxy-tetrahydrodipicolinate synthase [Acidobacteria bacterium]|nr:MAG: 4-hydroxy-tetrahydrodipicolinate synthase [Acidobacteriota bacterium]